MRRVKRNCDVRPRVSSLFGGFCKFCGGSLHIRIRLVVNSLLSGYYFVGRWVTVDREYAWGASGEGARNDGGSFFLSPPQSLLLLPLIWIILLLHSPRVALRKKGRPLAVYRYCNDEPPVNGYTYTAIYYSTSRRAISLSSFQESVKQAYSSLNEMFQPLSAPRYTDLVING